MTEYHRQLFEIKKKLLVNKTYAMKLLRSTILQYQKACPHCGILGHKNRHHTDHRGVHTFLCTACTKTYSELTGTLFFRSKISLSKWCLALLTWCNTTGSASAAHIAREVAISHAAAWHLLMKLRTYFAHQMYQDSLLTGLLEADEACFSKKENKQWVFGVVERGKTRKRLRLLFIPDRSEPVIATALQATTKPGGILCTDSWPAYDHTSIWYTHIRVNHSNHEFARDGYTSNHVEIVWGRIKGVLRTIHHGVTKRYLFHYLAEFCYSYEHKHSPNSFFTLLKNLFSPTYCLI